jgi:hypothetical protein
VQKIKNMKNLIENYFSGKTTQEEEQELFQYFSSEKIAPELLPYKTYFQSLANLKANAKFIIPKEEYENFAEPIENTTYYLKRIGIVLAVAASFALLLLLFPILHQTNNFVVINGKKYTDEKNIELAFHASLENVKLDVKQIFDDFDNDLFN